MNKEEFGALNVLCAAKMNTYLAEAQKTVRMLANCAPEPLPFAKRFALLRQEIIERRAHVAYREAKRLLHSAALLGYVAADFSADVPRSS